jgi:hypothetical protein
VGASKGSVPPFPPAGQPNNSSSSNVVDSNSISIAAAPSDPSDIEMEEEEEEGPVIQINLSNPTGPLPASLKLHTPLDPFAPRILPDNHASNTSLIRHPSKRCGLYHILKHIYIYKYI